MCENVPHPIAPWIAPYMPENILVVEYEPRYTDRVRHALAGQPFTPAFAKDGEEALRALDGPRPQLIVLSSVVPKVSTSELIKAIRGRDTLQQTPILLTVSGYNGKSPKQDAVRLGASDILPKPYSETEFLGKVQQMLGLAGPAASPGDHTLTSNDIFGDLLEERSPSPSGTRRPMKPTDDVDKLLADTLGGVMPQKKKETPPPAAPAPAKAKTDFDKALQDTLSGLEKNARRTSGGTASVPPAPAPAPAAPKPAPPAPPSVTQFNTEKIAISSPLVAPTPPPAPVEEEEPADGIRFGQYVLLEKIATGGMAEVWKARMRGVEGFQKIVAIKKILPHLSDNQDFIEMFIDEAKLAAQLNHNNIIHIYDLGKIQSSYYIAMEYIDGSDLKAILKKAQERDHPMSVELALFIASKIAAALDYAHRKHDFEGKEMGLVHRDVSPQNVLISEEGDIKLCDFGIAKAASKASHTQAGALKGKLQYMSPEQAWGRQIDKRSDIFALASVLFEMLTARKLFGGDNELSVLEQVREARVVAPSQVNDEVTPQIDQIVLKALQKEPGNRYQTAGEMQRDIDAVLYSFKPTPTSADLAIYMHRLSSTEPTPARVEPPMTHEPEPEPLAANELRPIAVPPPPAPVVAPAAASIAAAPSPAMPAWDAPSVIASAPSKKSPILAIVIGLVVVVAAVGGYFAFRGKSNTAKPSTATAAPVNKTASAAPAPVIPAPTATIAPAPGTVAPTSTAPAIDANQVNAEVQKRLAAERARLDQLARQQQQQTATQAPVLGRTTPQPQPAAVTQTVAPAPQPVVPPPQPVAPAPQPVAPAPQPEPQPQVQRAQLGELVASGTEGLAPARIARQAAATYPPIARMQHIQGTVIVNALVNENGQVIDTRVLSSASAILNEAAVQSIRRSSFSPGTKDGVRVKSWTAVRVEFKL
jgi:TonB family protein